ncbi:MULTISPECIES: hypothetical protein [unclassified Treponema]|uniref:hypothetical protein n=1 Tax=unclassified Treponema TaxID=2638727 RepID=UPI0020A55F21|nr:MULTISPECIES: hypothetical protein [unclassified Treponema]
MKKHFFNLVVFTIIVSTLFTGCETVGSGKGGKQPYFSEKNEQKPLKPNQKIGFTTEGLSEKIQFTKDGKRLMLPFAYQEAEKVFGFDKEEIEGLNSNSGNKFWYRMNKVLNTNEKQFASGAFNANNGMGNVLYILYLADFINMYEAKISSMVDMTNAPDWFKEVLEYRKTVPNYGKTDLDLELGKFIFTANPGDKSVRLSWINIPAIKKIVIKKGIGDEGFEILKTFEDGSTEFTVKNLENLKQHSFGIEGFDEKDERILRKWIVVTVGSNIPENYADKPSAFINKKADLLLNSKYKIGYRTDSKKINKIYFYNKDNECNIIFPSYQDSEDLFKYTDREKTNFKKKQSTQWVWLRLNKILNYGKNYPYSSAEINDWGGNVLWLLYCADFLNIYQKKLPNMVDLSNAPDWFKALMEQRKDSPDSYVKDEYK